MEESNTNFSVVSAEQAEEQYTDTRFSMAGGLDNSENNANFGYEESDSNNSDGYLGDADLALLATLDNLLEDQDSEREDATRGAILGHPEVYGLTSGKELSDTLFSLIGTKGAENLKIANLGDRILDLDNAIESVKQGKDAKWIKDVFGWEQVDPAKDAEDRLNWRYEESDFAMKPVHFKADEPMMLTDVAENDTLLAAYPKLKATKVVIDSSMVGGNANAHHDASANEIHINPLALKELPDGTFLRTQYTEGRLAHEIQHAIQVFEGFPYGTNYEAMAKVRRKVAFALLKDNILTRVGIMSPGKFKEKWGIYHEEVTSVSKALALAPEIAYHYSAGEVEAHVVAARYGLTPTQRSQSLVSGTKGYVPVKWQWSGKPLEKQLNSLDADTLMDTYAALPESVKGDIVADALGTDLSFSEALAGAGRQIAPVRLTDRNAEHILEDHPKEFKNDLSRVFAFLESTLGYITQIRKARGAALLAVVGNRKTNKAAILRLYPNPTSDYYNIETAGYYRESYRKEGENDILWERSEPYPSASVTDLSKPHGESKDGPRQINAESPKNSTGKVTNSSENSNPLADRIDTNFCVTSNRNRHAHHCSHLHVKPRIKHEKD